MQGQVIEQEPKIEKEEKEIMTFGGGVRWVSMEKV
jgi:hypothetical protein